MALHVDDPTLRTGETTPLTGTQPLGSCSPAMEIRFVNARVLCLDTFCERYWETPWNFQCLAWN